MQEGQPLHRMQFVSVSACKCPCVWVCVSVYVLTWWSVCLIPKAQAAKITPCVTLDNFYCSCLYFVYSRAHSKLSNNIYTEFKGKKKKEKKRRNYPRCCLKLARLAFSILSCDYTWNILKEGEICPWWVCLFPPRLVLCFTPFQLFNMSRNSFTWVKEFFV